MVDVGTKILAVLVIPLMLWGVKLEVELAVATEQRQVLEEKIGRMERENAAVIQTIQTNTLALGRLSVTMDHIKETVDEIRTEVRRDP
jgi:hypothetical protein